MTAAADRAAGDTGAQLLHQQLLEVEDHGCFQILHGLSDEAQLAAAHAQEAVGDRIAQAASQQQLQVGTAPLPAEARLGAPGQKAQTIAAAGQAQFQLRGLGIQRQHPRQLERARGPLGLQSQVELQSVAPQGDRAALQLQGRGAVAGLIQAQLQAQAGPPRS